MKCLSPNCEGEGREYHRPLFNGYCELCARYKMIDRCLEQEDRRLDGLFEQLCDYQAKPIKGTSDYIHYWKCKRGLWSYSSINKDDALRTAKMMFKDHYEEGHYT